MTGIVIDSKYRASNPLPLEFLKAAVSNETFEITSRIFALQSQPSPGALNPSSTRASSDASLEERLFEALANVKILTSQVAMHMDQLWRKRLFEQLDSLHDPAEWEEGDYPLQQQSFSTFLKAVLSIKPDRRPGLGMSSVGHLIAAWTRGPDRLTIEFLPNDRIRWVLARTVDGEVDRYAADTSVTRLAETLAPYHPEHWFTHGRQDHISA